MSGFKIDADVSWAGDAREAALARVNARRAAMGLSPISMPRPPSAPAPTLTPTPMVAALGAASSKPDVSPPFLTEEEELAMLDSGEGYIGGAEDYIDDEIEEILDSYAGDIYADVDLDTLLAAYAGEDSFAGFFETIGGVVKPVAHAVSTVAAPVAVISGVAAAGSAVVFPPAAPIFATVAAQAAVAGTIAAKLDAAIPKVAERRAAPSSDYQRKLAEAKAAEARRRAPRTPRSRQAAAIAMAAMAKAKREKKQAQRLMQATRAVAESGRATAAQRAGARAALQGVQAALTARQQQRRKLIAFVVTRKGFVLRVK